jgi:hypothetical protein
LPDISSLSLHPDNNGFSLNTKKHGVVEFSNFSSWRTTLIFNKVKNIKDVEPSVFSLIVAKYLIKEKEGIIYDENFYGTINSHEDIELILEKDELDNFSKEFISKNRQGIIHYYWIDTTSKVDDHTIIKQFFVKLKVHFDIVVEETTKFTKLMYDSNLLEQVKRIQEAAKDAFTEIPVLDAKQIDMLKEAAKINISNIPVLSDRELEAIKQFSSYTKNNNLPPLPQIETIKQFSSLIDNEKMPPLPLPDIPHDYKLETLCDIEKSLNSFINSYNSFKIYSKEMLEISNKTINNIRDSLELQIKTNKENFDIQIKINAENTKTANKHSKIAFILSITAIVLSVVFSIFQIFSVKNSNKHIDNLNLSIEQLGENIFEFNKSNSNYIEKIEALTDELIHQNEIKTNENGEKTIP